jgi:hypothetical protein
MNRKIVDYKTLYADSIADLDKNVREHIKHGWQPLGNQSLIVPTDYLVYESVLQVMVKYDD